mmetsp:Transcript_68229/g.197652  ORF Transcript_68229/g.197652 Transcript_68229/m.197652 type:complete len:213 (-) Transcript_68229:833-1471(-)
MGNSILGATQQQARGPPEISQRLDIVPCPMAWHSSSNWACGPQCASNAEAFAARQRSISVRNQSVNSMSLAPCAEMKTMGTPSGNHFGSAYFCRSSIVVPDMKMWGKLSNLHHDFVASARQSATLRWSSSSKSHALKRTIRLLVRPAWSTFSRPPCSTPLQSHIAARTGVWSAVPGTTKVPSGLTHGGGEIKRSKRTSPKNGSAQKVHVGCA